MKKFAIILTVVAMLAALMFAEYRYIMHNLQPYYADGYVFIDFMGQTDMYKNPTFFVTE